MKTLGLVGGTSWHSTIEYYRIINQFVNQHFGDNTNPPLLLFNMNQSRIHHLQRENKWDEIAELFFGAAECLQKAGAQAVIFCANTPHKIYPLVESRLDVPILHICDATSNAIKETGLSKVGLIGTRFSMEQDFLVHRFATNEVEAIVPANTEEIVELHRIIQEELTFGNIVESSKRFVLNSVQSLADRGAQGIVLGCTEFPLMLNSEDIDFPMFNTTQIHAETAAQFTLSE